MRTRNYLTIIGLLFCLKLSSQIAIGKNTVDGSGLLDFASGTTRGIVLPYVDNTVVLSGIVPGTLFFDVSDSKIKCYIGAFQELSTNIGPSMSASSVTEIGGGIIIGQNSSLAQGALILESDNKALILPKVASPHLKM